MYELNSEDADLLNTILIDSLRDAFSVLEKELEENPEHPRNKDTRELARAEYKAKSENIMKAHKLIGSKK